MAKVYDYKIDVDGDEMHANGDVVVDECTLQNQKLLIITEKGTLKHEPIAGVGILTWILDESDGDDLKKEIQSEFEGDGMRIDKLKGNSLNDIDITAHYV